VFEEIYVGVNGTKTWCGLPEFGAPVCSFAAAHPDVATVVVGS